MAKITLRFVTSAGIASDLIARGQLGVGFPTHVEFRVDDGRLLGAHIEGGVIYRPAGYDDPTLLAEHFIVVPCTDGQLEAATAFMLNQVGKPYDVVAIASLAAGAIAGVERDWRAVDSWFCSEFCAATFDAGGIFRMPIGVNHVTPLMLYCGVAARVGDIGKPRVTPAGAVLFPGTPNA